MVQEVLPPGNGLFDLLAVTQLSLAALQKACVRFFMFEHPQRVVRESAHRAPPGKVVPRWFRLCDQFRGGNTTYPSTPPCWPKSANSMAARWQKKRPPGPFRSESRAAPGKEMGGNTMSKICFTDDMTKSSDDRETRSWIILGWRGFNTLLSLNYSSFIAAWLLQTL